MTTKAPFLRTPYNYDVEAASVASGLLCEDPSKAVQDAKDEVDINTIVRRFGLTGELPEGVRAPQYADFDDVWDYHSAMNAIGRARDSFYQLPGEVRATFDNDAGKFVDFCSDERNREKAIELGLVVRPPAASAPSAPAAPAAALAEKSA
ncbi:MAG: internal scaffolding protein [Arizlama microvirus]|nr:MAG: internal scaffolding protein [Arizlama microvirus]